jgi:hypothetical protein
MRAFIRAGALIFTTAINVGTPAFAQYPVKCFKMHGHVAPGAGHPTYRVNPETRSGLIALQERDAHGKFIDPLPSNVRRLFPRDQRAVETVVTGDFTICPLEPPRPNKLRLARMVEAKNLSVRTEDWLETGR